MTTPGHAAGPQAPASIRPTAAVVAAPAQATATDATTAAVGEPVILCVDDESNILSSLRRLFRGQGYQVLTATSAMAALEILRHQAVDLVISDMRMPEMDGARFLETVREHWPQTVRLLLTGYADVGSILDAINRGEIHRYITKPWDDNDIRLIVRHALERQQLEHERRRLELLTISQNEALKTLNASLEEKVRLRTAALSKARDGLLKFNARLKENFLVSIKVFSHLIEMRGGSLAGHSARVASLARKIAVRLKLDERETEDLFVAALLHTIGKISLPDELLQMPESAMSGEQLALYRKHPLRGEQLLMPLDDLRGAAALVRACRERFDCSGYPDGLTGFEIPIGSRILAVASDYDSLQNGMLGRRRLRPEEASAVIRQGRGVRYDPLVTDAFLAIIEGAAAATEPGRASMMVNAGGLRPGMVLARDLLTADGSMLLSADHVLDARLIRQIVDFEKTQACTLAIAVYRE